LKLGKRLHQKSLGSTAAIAPLWESPRNFGRKLIANEEISVNGLNLLRLCLSQLGATPVDASKIT
jgi:hypothetical protein